jgi:RNA recognition motif-containing protein
MIQYFKRKKNDEIANQRNSDGEGNKQNFFDYTLDLETSFQSTASFVPSKISSNNNPPTKPDLHFFVGHLPPKTDENSLKNYFIRFGELTDVFVARDKRGNSRQFGYITFSSFYGRSSLSEFHTFDGR